MSGLTDEEKKIAERCFDYMKSIQSSPSHGTDHAGLTLKYALGLAEELERKHKINRKALIIAAILHDASRHTGAKGETQGLMSANMIKKFVKELGLAFVEESIILDAIINHSLDRQKHDLPIESKILYDADKLAGMGLLGFIRICMYAGECGKGLEHIKKKLLADYNTRLNNLHFEESKAKAAALDADLVLIREFMKNL
jgi:hypothetical protein